jgi:anti-sigma factor RsiW
MSGADRARLLLTAVLDGEASTGERRELEALMAADPALEREYQEMQRIKETTMSLQLKEPPAELWDTYWEGVYRRIERGVGWLLVAAGTTVLLVFAAISWVRALLADTGLEWWLKAAILALVGGLVVLLVSVVREKLFLHESERYKDVRR